VFSTTWTFNTSNIFLYFFQARKALTFIIFPDKDFKWSIHLGTMTFLLTFINILVIFVPSIREVFGIIGKHSVKYACCILEFSNCNSFHLV